VDFGIDAPSWKEHRLPLSCPRDLEPYFLRLEAPRELVKTFVQGDPPVIGTTYLAPAFALGSINRGDLWNQRRSLVAYWGTQDRPSYLHFRFLHDGYDFSAAQFFSAQRKGDVLAAVNFAVDGGDRHVSLDRIRNATIRARDLRLRFELGGAAARVELRAPAALTEPALCRFGDLRLQILVPFAVFGDNQGRWKAGREGGRSFLDVVLYEGEERTVRLSELDEAAIGCALRFTTGEAPVPDVHAAVREGRLSLRFDPLELRLPVRPARASELRRGVKWGRSGS
jgi:hypothetical protein